MIQSFIFYSIKNKIVSADRIKYNKAKTAYVYAQEGDIFYRGFSKRNGSQINVMQVTTGDDGTYEATNGNIIYSINPDRLQVRQNGKVILTEAVIK